MTARASKAEDDRRLLFWCPGCQHAHMVRVSASALHQSRITYGGGSSTWSWNGDLERPTISPSVLVHPHQTLVDDTLEGPALTAPENVTTTPLCHSFVTDGRIEFLGDSTHALAGQTVDLPEWPPR